MANILDDICVDGAVLSPKLERQISNLSREIERQSGGLLFTGFKEWFLHHCIPLAQRIQSQ